jgi:hypothetical protein
MKQIIQKSINRMKSNKNGCSLDEADSGACFAINRGWLLAAAVLGFLLIIPNVITRPLFNDDAYYIWGATQIHHGCYPVRDFFAIDPAGTWAYFCWTRYFFGEGSVGYWIMITANVVITACLLGMLARDISNSFISGIWTAFLFMLFQLMCVPAPGLVGKDMIGFPFVLGGLMLATRLRWWIAAHLLVGIGLAIKPTIGAIWLIWMAGDFCLRRGHPVRWLLRAVLASVAIGIPFLAATFWAEQHNWGWVAFKVNVGLRSGGYGAYWSGGTLYNFLHAILPALWLLPFVVAGCRNLISVNWCRQQLLLSVLVGGFINWAIQPMFNGWYFVPFFGGSMVLAGLGVGRLLRRMSGQIALMICAGLFFAFVPATNLRWLKLITDIKGKKKYTLAEHQSRMMAEYGMGNTPPHVQEWIRQEVSQCGDKNTKVGLLVTDGCLLWALRDYRPGFWAVWSPSWNPQRVAEGVASGSADVIVSIEDISACTNSNLYYDQVAKLRWNIPDQALTALNDHYQAVARGFGYVIYQKRK